MQGIRRRILTALMLVVCVPSRLAQICADGGSGSALCPPLEALNGGTITADSTCGSPSSNFCYTDPQTSTRDCNNTCDATSSTNRHPPADMLDFRDSTWWQSKNGDEIVLIEYEFPGNKTYEIDYIAIYFRGYLPESFFLIKSPDFEETLETYQFYSYSCQKTYGVAPNQIIFDVTTPICDDLSDSTSPVIRFRPLEGRPSGFGREAWITATRLQLHFRAVQTNSSDDRDIYYAIETLQVLASCKCNGHADRCLQDAITGQQYCDCQHNTQGIDCEACLPFYNNKPYEQGSECEACSCHEHSTSCQFNQTLYEMNGNKDGGVCTNCEHNTAGNQCDHCAPMYYPNSSLPLTHPNICLECDCFLAGVEGGELDCEKESNDSLGDCLCKMNVMGRRCDACEIGFWNLTQSNPDGCSDCGCNLAGTVNGNLACDTTTGQCECKTNVEERTCDSCKDGYYNMTQNNADGCTPCDCNGGGSLDHICDKTTGQCSCRDGVTGRDCSEPIANAFLPPLDYNLYEAESSNDGSATPVSFSRGAGTIFTGTGYAAAKVNDSVVFSSVTVPKGVEYQLVIRYTYNDSMPWSSARVSIVSSGGSGMGSLPVCSEENRTSVAMLEDLSTGEGVALVVPFVSCLRAGVNYTVGIAFLRSGSGQPDATFFVDSLHVLPVVDVNNFDYFAQDSVANAMFVSAGCQTARLTVEGGMSEDPICRTIVSGISAELYGKSLDCNCNSVGSTGNTCNSYTGQCSCRSFVFGRTCDSCLPAYHSLSSVGCRACACETAGSQSDVCDVESGNCSCIDLVQGQQCDHCVDDYFGFNTPTGCQPCHCNVTGSTLTQCDNAGQCDCKFGVDGIECTHCESGFYDFSTSGCTSCDCNVAGSLSSDCSSTGACSCKQNVDVETTIKCDVCKMTYFNLESSNPLGCQPCFGYGHALDCSPSPDYTSDQVDVDFDFSGQAEYEIVRADDGTIVDLVLVTRRPAPREVIVHNSFDPNVTLLFKMPSSFYGNRVSSYAKTLTVSLRLESSVSVDMYGGPDVVLTNSYGDRIETNLSPTPSTVRHLYAIRLDDTVNWTSILSGSNQSSRALPFDIQRVLVSLTSITVRASYSPFVGTVFDEASLQISVKSNASDVDWVERSICPAEYAGTLCERCADGYTRSVRDGDSFTACVPCQCNNRSDVCDGQTGVCDCRDNTAGDQCDICAVGFYRNASGECVACPCPLTSSDGQFTTSCELRSGVVTCLDCPDGHAGDDCGQCLPGYFGDPYGAVGAPMGCSNCSCNGNINASDPSSCDRTTGQCLLCLYDTAGNQCERCRDDYYGSAVAKNCTPCHCDATGSVTSQCIETTGKCICKPNVVGFNCTECDVNHFNFTDAGCSVCECHSLGSESAACDVNTGICSCKMGVDGDKCDRCQEGFFGLDASACTACNCHPQASTGIGCDQNSGQCSCSDGSMGLQCNVCSEGYFNVSAGCQACECNNHSSTCDVVSGLCTGCADNTYGDHCEFCLSGYYGDATAGTPNDCSVCPCPGISNSFSDLCELTPGGARCTNCSEGHSGDQCEFCADGFFGDPAADVGCGRCLCSGNIDLNATGNCDTTTGECLKCLYNTFDSDCSVCAPGFYGSAFARNCTECNCNAFGSVDPIGACFGELGECLCMPNVVGLKCDQCDSGYYNLTATCATKCQCNSNGSLSDDCDQMSGECQCKTGVEGHLCDACAPGFYGFDANGCKACNCFQMGSLDPVCDQDDGQCNCSSTTTGRTCNACIRGHFDLASGCLECNCNNHTLFCDDTDGTCIDCQDNTRGDHCEECSDGFYGFADRGTPTDCRPCLCPSASSPANFSSTCRLLNDGLTINCTACPKSHAGLQCESCADGFYGDPRNGVGCRSCDCNGNVDVNVTDFCDTTTGVCRDCVGDTDGDNCQMCATHFYGDAIVAKNCTACECNSSGVVVGSACNGATGQCDCLPNVVGRRCDACDVDHWDFGSVLGCEPCDCDPTGAVATDCDLFSGQCNCRPGVGGRRCDQCLSGYFNMSRSGCQECDCFLPGSIGSECDDATGQCNCTEGARGLKCDSCRDFYFNLTDGCQPCVCNGHAMDCDVVTGVCISCTHETEGDQCERCKSGFYGDPTQGTPSDCLPCSCPGNSVNTSFSPTCGIDGGGQLKCDACASGHVGDQCENCGAGFFGDPNAGVACSDCTCSGNINVTDPDSCDSTTGRCLKCLYDTAGDLCDLCRSGFYGNAMAQNCTVCPCDPRGTLDCDRLTGLCICRQNVLGPLCDRCEDEFYDVTNPSGCLACQCNTTGSTVSLCNKDDGQCDCEAGVDGRACDRCSVGFYDFGPDGCRSCDCNADGSTSAQCDDAGQCPCRTGVTGLLCDRCAENYAGNGTDCVRCDSCYDDLKVSVDDLRGRFASLTTRIDLFESTRSSESFADRLADVDERLRRLDVDVQAGEASVADIRRQIADIDAELTTLWDEASALQTSTRSLDSTANTLIVRADSLVDTTRSTERTVTSSYETIDQTIQPAVVSSEADLAEILSLNQSTNGIAASAENLAVNQTAVAAALTNSSLNSDAAASSARVFAEDALSQATIDSRTLFNVTSSVDDRREAVDAIGSNLTIAESRVSDAVAAAADVSNRSSKSREDFGLSRLGDELSAANEKLASLDEKLKNVVSTSSSVAQDSETYRNRVDGNLVEVARDETLSQGFENRADDALAKGEAAVSSTSATLSAANDMLDILKNFNDRITTTSASAAKALEQVEGIRNSSRAAADQATQILQDNQMAQEDAAASRLSALKAEMASNDAFDTVTTVLSESRDPLKTAPIAKSDADQVKIDAIALNETAESLVARCTANRTVLDGYVASTENVEADILACENDTDALRVRVQELMSALENIERLDDNAVQSVRQTVDDLSDSLVELDLAREIESLRQVAAEQRAAISVNDAQIASLEREIEEVSAELSATCV